MTRQPPPIFTQILDMLNIKEPLVHYANVVQTAVFPQKCFSTARSFTQAGKSSYYIEGFLMPEGLPIPIGHAWFVDEKGVHNDMTHVNATDIYWGIAVPAGEFNKHMQNPEFEREYLMHDMMPYHRTLAKLHPKSSGGRSRKGVLPKRSKK